MKPARTMPRGLRANIFLFQEAVFASDKNIVQANIEVALLASLARDKHDKRPIYLLSVHVYLSVLTISTCATGLHRGYKSISRGKRKQAE